MIIIQIDQRLFYCICATYIGYIYFKPIFLKNTYLNNYVQTNFKNTLINLTYTYIYYYSRVQLYLIQFNIIKKKVIKFISSNIFKKNASENYEIIKNGKIQTITKQILDNDTDLINSCHLIIYSDYTENDDNQCINKIVLHPKAYNSSNDYTTTNYSFIQSNIVFEDGTEIDLKFKNENYNYYIVGNIINKKFILYFLRKHYTNHVKDFSDNFITNYKIKIIDQNINILQVNDNEVLEMKQDNYTIYKEDCKEEIAMSYNINLEQAYHHDIDCLKYPMDNKKISDSLCFTNSDDTEDYLKI
jgi:hypothetical protein